MDIEKEIHPLIQNYMENSPRFQKFLQKYLNDNFNAMFEKILDEKVKSQNQSKIIKLRQQFPNHPKLINKIENDLKIKPNPFELSVKMVEICNQGLCGHKTKLLLDIEKRINFLYKRLKIYDCNRWKEELNKQFIK